MEEMRSLSFAETKAVAWELAHASYNWLLAIEKPSRLTRAAELDLILRQALRAPDLGNEVSKRDQLGATNVLQQHLRGFESPGHRERILTVILKLLWPAEGERLELATILPDGMTRYDVWDLCQHDWCSIKCSETYPKWLQMTSLETVRCPVEGSYCRLPDDNPLTILFQWSLALHNGSIKLQDPLTLQQWHARASSISHDHNVWRFASAYTFLQEDDTADFRAYVRCFPPIGGVPIYLQWAIDRTTACGNIEKLHLVSKCQLQPLMRRLWPENPDDRRPIFGRGEAADRAEKRAQLVIHALYPAAYLWRGGRASSSGPAPSEQLRLRPSTYVKQLVFRCGFRGEAAHARRSAVQIDQSQQAAGMSEAAAAQKLRDSSGRDTISSHNSRSEADANADALLLEEEAEKARAQARMQARQQRRARKSVKAGSSAKHSEDGLSRPQQALEARSSDEAAGAQPAEMPAVMSPLKQSASDPPQDSAAAASGCEQRTDISSSTACLQNVTYSLKAMVLAPTTDDEAKPSSQKAALHMSSPTKPGSANAGPQSPAAPQDAHPSSPAAEHWQGLQPCGTSTGAAGPDELYEAKARSADGELAYSPGASRLTEPLEQEAATNRDPHSSGERQPWHLARQGQSQCQDPGRLQGAMANDSSPQSHHRPSSPLHEAASGDVSASIRASAGRCQPRATSKALEPSAHVRAGFAREL